jgi:hypothetical protein
MKGRVMNAVMPREGEIGEAVGGWVAALQLGRTMRIGALDIAPLVTSRPAVAPDLLAYQALADGRLEVVEKGAGDVNLLLARSTAAVPVVILEGDMLIGAKQNRLVAHTVVVGPGTRVEIPVGCMERGRWDARPGGFAAGVGVAEARMRRDLKMDVMASRRHGHRGSVDQSRLWDQVSHELTSCRVQSETSDYNVVAQRNERDRAPLHDVRPDPGQVGLIAMHEGDLVAMEVVGHPVTWEGLYGRVLSSLAPEVVDRPRGRRRRGSGEWMGAIRDAALRLTDRPAVGIGRDVELVTRHLIGSGVWVGDRMAHLSVYAPA